MAKLIDIKGWVVSVVGDLIDMGITEDGSPFHAESYCVEVRRPDGKTYVHEIIYPGAERFEDYDSGYWGFADIRKESKAKVERLVERVKEAGKINLDYWVEGRPSYGSEYYCKVNGF